jgi:RNA polymerase sigma-70 factor (ECF subfamily)
MDGVSASETSATLLGRVGQTPADAPAWDEFVHRYGPLIYTWCRRWQLADPDAEDVTQNVLLKVFSRMSKFEYDPQRSFRAWLKTVTHHAWRDYVNAKHHAGQCNGNSTVRREVENRQPHVRRCLQDLDRELLVKAIARVRKRVAAHTWEAFRLLMYDGLPATDVGHRTGMRPSAVWVAKNKVLRMLREEIARLNGALR